MARETGVVTEIRCQVPVVPAVIAAKRHLVLAAGGAGDSNRNGIGLAAGAGESDHVRPGMQIDEAFGEVHLFGAVEGAHVASVDRRAHRRIDVRMPVAEQIGSDAH